MVRGDLQGKGLAVQTQENTWPRGGPEVMLDAVGTRGRKWGSVLRKGMCLSLSLKGRKECVMSVIEKRLGRARASCLSLRDA